MKRSLISGIAATLSFAVLPPLFLAACDSPAAAKKILIAHPQRDCSLNEKACTTLLPHQGEIALSIQPRPIPASTPVQIEIRTTDIVPAGIEIDFSGVEMNMGPNRLVLSGQDGRHFHGEATLPACVSGAMEWQATVLLETPEAQIIIPYRFSTGAD